MATNGLVLVWHSMLDTEFRKPIIAGLTKEIIGRFGGSRRAATAQGSHDIGCRLNTEELKIELDMLVQEHGITPMLHTLGCRPLMEEGRITAMLVENKDGRGAVRAGVFIDATGDGDVAVRAGVPSTVRDELQPPTPLREDPSLPPGRASLWRYLSRACRRVWAAAGFGLGFAYSRACRTSTWQYRRTCSG